MADNNFDTTVESLFRGMDSYISSKTVVGEAVTVGDTIILPLVDVTFGMGAGATGEDKKQKGVGGIGGKLSPCAVLVIHNGTTRLVNIKNQDTVTKILDMVPDVIDKFNPKQKKKFSDDVEDAIHKTVQNSEEETSKEDSAE